MASTSTIVFLAASVSAFCWALSLAAPSPAAAAAVHGQQAGGGAVVALYDPSTNTVWVDDGGRYAKRSPSIGLSLAEYMAQPPSSDSFHFLSGKK